MHLSSLTPHPSGITLSNTYREVSMPALTQKGQVTIPKAVRQLLGVQTGDEVEFVVRGGRVELQRAARGHQSAYGLLRAAGAEPCKAGEEEEALMEALLEDDNRIRRQE